MWAIRILSGQQVGQIFPLRPGKHVLGRGPTCEIKLNSNSVSKEHASLLITGDKVIVTDLESRNGTFVNGVRVQNQRLKLGDKISVHDVLLELMTVPDGVSISRPINSAQGLYEAAPPAWAGNLAVRMPQEIANPGYTAQPSAHASSEPNEVARPQMSANSIGSLFYNFKIYIDSVAMPGVYALVQSMPYRYALALLVCIYILTVTALSTIPVVQTTKQNIRQESVRRAKTIARNMAANNRAAIIEGNEVALNVRAAELEEGVTTAVLISAKDGTILAPASKRGEFVDKPFIQRARREEKEMSDFIDDSNLGVSVPITVFNPASGSQPTIAYAIVLYDMGALAMNASQTLSLFIQTLAISLLVGAFLYFFLFKIVENPVDVLNGQLDDALREGRDDLRTDYQYPSLERLASNINSALSRIGRGGPEAPAVFINRDGEAANLVRIATAAAVAVNAIDDRVIATNRAFDQLVGGGMNLQGRSLTEIPDVALQENLRELLPMMRSAAGDIATSQIPFSGNKFEINGQAVMGRDEPAYYLIIISPMEDHG